jgi:hypothetical protein
VNTKCGHNLQSRIYLIYKIMCITKDVGIYFHDILHMHLLDVSLTGVCFRKYGVRSRPAERNFVLCATNPLQNSLQWHTP